MRVYASLIAVVSLSAAGCKCPSRTADITAAIQPAGDVSPAAGGYSAARATDADVVKAAKFAVSARSKSEPGAILVLDRVVSAQQQVVAGLNYRMVLTVKQNGASRTAEAVVWWQSWNPDQPYTLTSWTWQ